MGMAASQVGLLRLTSRNNDIGYQLNDLSLQKTALTREMTKVTLKYKEALSSKVFKCTNNAGATTVDLSYNALMRPGTFNQNNPYFITNSNGKIVLDSKYADYAKMISPDGKAGGDWASNRTQILSELIDGLTPEKIENANSTSAAKGGAAEDIEKLKLEKSDLDKEELALFKPESTSDFLGHAGTISAGSSFDIAKLYSNASAWTDLGDGASAKSNLNTLLTGICNNMKDYLSDDAFSCLNDAKDAYISDTSQLLTNPTEDDKVQLKDGKRGIKLSGNKYSINIKQAMDEFLGCYKNACDKKTSSNIPFYSGDSSYYTCNRSSDEWIAHQEKVDDWQKRYTAATGNYNSAVDADNMSLDSNMESQIKFYDQIFTAIAENGWVENGEISDSDYLNNMLQNNQYYVMTMKDQVDNDGKHYNEYNSTIASNFDRFVSVNDSDLYLEAQVEYEYEKGVINEKESRIDTRMKNLETEQAAIKKMMDGMKTVEKENSERTMNIFG